MPNVPDPNSRRSRVLRWLSENPGFHRCADIAAALGDDTHGVAVACRNLMIRGDIERHHTDPKRPGGMPGTLYGVNPATQKETA